MKNNNLIALSIVILYGLVHHFIHREYKLYISIIFLVSMILFTVFSIYLEPNKLSRVEKIKTSFSRMMVIAMILGIYFFLTNKN
jgi:hypothetical protein